MAFVFELPEIGEGVVEGEVVAWKVQLGQRVERDQPLCEIMTDKATVEISSPTTGVLTKTHGQPGDIIKVHAPLAEIDENGVADSATAQGTPAKAPSAPAKLEPAQVAAPVVAPAAVPPTRRTQGAPPAGPAKAAPAVRRDARERGIDLQDVAGTGPGGRITRDDLAAFSSGTTPVAPRALPQVAATAEDQVVKIIGLRRKIAQQMLSAKQTAPHFTYVEEIDATELVALRSRLKETAAARGVKLTYLPFILKALSVAFRDFPNVNATMNNDTYELTVRGHHNIGIATDTDQGLFVPVIKDVQAKSILHLAWEMADLTERTRAGKASLEDLSGGTFTVTSVGNIGGMLATPILNVPEVAILGVNAIRERAVVRDGQIVARQMLYLSPAFDHRIIDGAVAARFVARLKELLEDPACLLVELT
jgi:pyruvate/2-oxoglutarate dehydrogenase complex dihydrolipoamide acyltransferase (E2) component